MSDSNPSIEQTIATMESLEEQMMPIGTIQHEHLGKTPLYHHGGDDFSYKGVSIDYPYLRFAIAEYYDQAVGLDPSQDSG